MTVRAKGLDHVAIVVRDLEESIPLWRDALGLELTHVEEVPEQQVKTAIFGHGMGRVELICPTTPDSGVAKFLASRGEGLHHVCIEVEDIESAMDVAPKGRGPADRPGAPSRRGWRPRRLRSPQGNAGGPDRAPPGTAGPGGAGQRTIPASPLKQNRSC